MGGAMIAMLMIKSIIVPPVCSPGLWLWRKGKADKIEKIEYKAND